MLPPYKNYALCADFESVAVGIIYRPINQNLDNFAARYRTTGFSKGIRSSLSLLNTDFNSHITYWKS